MSNKEINQEPIFKGNFKDFKKYFDGYVRNSVQEITNKYKEKIKKCEYKGCSKTKPEANLEAAHKTSRDKIIKDAIINSEINKNKNENETTDDFKENKIRSVDLNLFNILNKIYHTDPEEFHFLCKDHHKNLDDKKKKNLDDKKKNKDIEFDETKIKRTKNISKIAVETYINILLEILYEKWKDMKKASSPTDISSSLKKIVKITLNNNLIGRINNYFAKYDKLEEKTKKFRKSKDRDDIYDELTAHILLKILKEPDNKNPDSNLIDKINEYLREPDRKNKKFAELIKEACNNDEKLEEELYKQIKTELKNNLINYYKKV